MDVGNQANQMGHKIIVTIPVLGCEAGVAGFV
jgi:hypothetical protein